MPDATLILALIEVAVTTTELFSALTAPGTPLKVSTAPASNPAPVKVTIPLAPTATKGGLALIDVTSGVISTSPGPTQTPVSSTELPAACIEGAM